MLPLDHLLSAEIVCYIMFQFFWGQRCSLAECQRVDEIT